MQLDWKFLSLSLSLPLPTACSDHGWCWRYSPPQYSQRDNVHQARKTGQFNSVPRTSTTNHMMNGTIFQVFSALSQVSKHSVELAEMVVDEAEIFPATFSSLRDPDDYVIKNVATLIREIAKHSPEVWRERKKERERERCCTYMCFNSSPDSLIFLMCASKKLRLCSLGTRLLYMCVSLMCTTDLEIFMLWNFCMINFRVKNFHGYSPLTTLNNFCRMSLTSLVLIILSCD